MKKLLLFLILGALAARAQTAPLAIETQVAEATRSDHVTIVHFWAPWCPNCKAELADHGWKTFIEANPSVKVIFVTTWNPTDGRDVLTKNGVGDQANFTLLLHPNGSRKKGDKVTQFLGLPVSWIPSTWIFKDGKLRYAMNFGELHFPMLQQLVVDSSSKWEH